jgi:hypothetical protein
MNNSATQMYAVSLDQCVDAIVAYGDKRTILAQGHMGIGKSSMLTTLAERLPNHTPCYFDCTTKDLGDIMIPKMAQLDGQNYVTYATNEELGVHLNKPIILMIDEFGKANPAVKNALLRIILERKIGSYELPEGSIVFATTNLGAEGVGDMLLPHQRDRVATVKIRKPDHLEWIEWGINNDVHPSVLGFVKDFPAVLQTFEDVKDPTENPYIYHPQLQRTAFTTPRSLHMASDLLHARGSIDDHTLTSLLMGTIGEQGAMDMMAFVKLADQLPSLDSIKNDPKNARVPDSASATCMVVYRSLASMEKDWINAWMDYMPRLNKEAQGMFVNGARNPKYSRIDVVMSNAKFTEWAKDNTYMFTADKK